MKGRQGATYSLVVLTVINLLNYLDRYILPGVMVKVQAHFNLNDTQGGLLTTVFIIVYLCASPIGGFLGDRMPRRVLIGIAVLVWSIATIASGLATSFVLLLIARAFTGVGEAGYGTVAPSFISDLYPKEKRTRMLSFFYVAMPLGAALGFILGGLIAEKHSWQMAFFVGGVPGLLLGAFAFFMAEPKRGAMDPEGMPRPVPILEGLRALWSNSRFWFTVAGLTLMTFSVGGLSVWMPKFLAAERGFSTGDAGFALGATTVVGGILGTLAGGFLGDSMDKKRAGGGILLSGLGLLFAVPLMLGAAMVESHVVMLGCLGLAQFLLLLNNGPLNAAIVNVVPPAFRSSAFGISTMLLHLLGDAASPTVIGVISDHSSLGVAIKLNAIPVAVGGVVLLIGARVFARHAATSASTSSSAA